MSAETGIETDRTIRVTAANISSAGVDPSSYPSDADTPALGVARAGKPASSKTRALAASQGPGRISGSPGVRPWCRARKAAAGFSCAIRSLRVPCGGSPSAGSSC